MSKLARYTSRFVRQNLISNKFLGMLERVDRMDANFLRVLTYHHVFDSSINHYSHRGITVRPDDFERQIHFLVKNYHLISMQELLKVSRKDGALPSHAVLVTFDDGYYDFAENAWPILKKYQVPVALFVPTAFPDHPERVFWWEKLFQAVNMTERIDDLGAEFGLIQFKTQSQREKSFRMMRDYVKSKPHEAAMEWVDVICKELGVDEIENQVMGWDTLRKLANEGVTMGAHTRTHPMMDRISIDQALLEAHGSLQDLEREIGPTLPIFAYPGGHLSEEVVRGLKEIGFVLAFTTMRGLNDLNRMDWFRIRRINIGPSTTLPILRAQLLSWLVHLDKLSVFANT